MALSANTVFEVRTDGNDTNGGGFVTGASGTDWSQQAAAQYSVTDGVTNGTTTITSATANFGTDVVGNLIYVQGGTGSVAASWYEITSRTNSTTIVVDRSTGLTAGTGVTLKIGGALASPGGLGALLVAAGGITAGQKAYVKSGTYNLSGTTVNVSGGPLDLSVANLTNKQFWLKGYQTSRADLTGTRPTIDVNGNAPTNVIKLGGNASGSHTISNFAVDGESRAVNGILGNNSLYDFADNCHVFDCDATFAFSQLMAIKCKAYSCAAIGFSGCNSSFCWADANETGFSTALGGTIANCIASNNSVDGFNSNSCSFVNCTSYNNTADGFEIGNAARASTFTNCISFSDGGYGFKGLAQAGPSLFNCAYGADGGGSGRTDVTPPADVGAITLTADPFTNAASGDFSLNNTAGGGALLRAAGFSPYGQTGYLDVGAVQHQDAGTNVIVVEDD